MTPRAGEEQLRRLRTAILTRRLREAATASGSGLDTNDERRRNERIERIEQRLSQQRCVDCGSRKGLFSFSWVRCQVCASLICGTCHGRATYVGTERWRCPGCGAVLDEDNRWHDGIYGSIVTGSTGRGGGGGWGGDGGGGGFDGGGDGGGGGADGG